MTELSIFKNFNKVVENKSIDEILELIKSGKFKNQIQKLQKLLNKGKDKEYNQAKKSLAAFTPSAGYIGGRKAEFLEEYSRIIILDIDKIETELQTLKSKAIACEYTLSCFISPSGKGLKILVKSNNSIQKHLEAFLQIQRYYEELLNIKIDPSGKDVSRLCFFSYDSNLYHNPESKTFKLTIPMEIKNDTEKLIEQIETHKIDITNDYKDWLKIGFAIESEFGEAGRDYFHAVSKYSTQYNSKECDLQYDKCLKNNNSGITIKSLFHFAKQYGVIVKSEKIKVENDKKIRQKTEDKSNIEQGNERKITSNKFTITEEYLNQRYVFRYNTVSNKFEYKKKSDKYYKELNENNLYVKLQKDNVNISINNLIALLKSDYINEFNPFIAYFENLPRWDEKTDHIQNLTSFLKTNDSKRLEKHFKKWLVRAVRTSIDDNYFNKQAFVLVSNKQNSGKSTFCRFLCPPQLKDYIVENIGTDKDSLIAITENFLINLDELSTAEKNEINAFKSMFSKDKIKARLTYDKRASIHVRRANFIGSTDRWEFLTDENGSVRWLCFDIEYIDWTYDKKVDINKVYSQAYFLLINKNFEYDLTAEEIKENDYINKKYQVSSPERDLIQKHFKRATKNEKSIFMTATDIIEYISKHSNIKISTVQIGKEMKFLGYERVAKYLDGNAKYGYNIIKIFEQTKN